MVNKKLVFIILGIVLVFSCVAIYIIKNKQDNKLELQKSIYNAYPTRLYYNDKKLDTAFLYWESAYVQLELLEKMGFSVSYEAIDPREIFGENYYNSYDVYGTITISDGVDRVLIMKTAETNGVERVFKNNNDVTVEIGSSIHLLTEKSITADIKRFMGSQYVNENNDLTVYLQKDKIYIEVKDLFKLFDNYTLYFDESKGYVYVTSENIN